MTQTKNLKKPSKAFGEWCFTALTICFVLLLAVTPFIFTWFNEELFEFNKMVFVYGLTILIGIFWFLRAVFDQKIYWRRTPFDIPLLLFLLSQIISTILSIHFRTSIFGYYTRFNAGLLPTFCYIFLFYALVGNFTKKDLPRFFWWTFLTGAIISVYGTLEHFGHSPSCFIINFGNYLKGRVSADSTFGVACWVQLVQERVFASFGQPNWLATYCVTLIPLGFSFRLINQYEKVHKIPSQKALFGFTHRQNLLLTISTILLFAVLLFTKSRSGFLAIAIASLLYFAGTFLIYFRQKMTKEAWLKPLLQFGISFATLALIFGTPYTPSLSELWQKIAPPVAAASVEEIIATANPKNKLALTTRLTEGTDSGDIRKVVWKGAIDVWKRYPWFGSGLETFGYSYYLDRPAEHNLTSEWDFLYNKAHNEFLNYLSTTGVIGLLTYLLIIIVFAVLTLKTAFDKKQTVPFRLISLGFLTAICAMMVANFFGFSTVFSNVLLFLIPGFYLLCTQDSLSSKKINVSKLNRYISLGLAGFITTILFIQLSDFWTADWHFAQAKSQIRLSGSGGGNLNVALQHFQAAIQLEPKEALFQSELADIYSQLAVAYHKKDDTIQANFYADQARETMERVLQLNPVHLNFQKTALRVYLNLAQINLTYLNHVENILSQALAMAPTDAKLWYNMAIIYFNTNRSELGMNTLKYLLDYLRPNYHEARYFYAQRLEEQGDLVAALENYQYVLEWIDPHDVRSNEAVPRLTATLATMSGTTAITTP